jgi:hypothetical protein
LPGSPLFAEGSAYVRHRRLQSGNQSDFLRSYKKFRGVNEMATNTYESPLNSRYASKEMQYIFSPDKKFSTWRKLWIALAESEKELGLDITDKQIAQMKEHIYDINYDVAKAREKEVRHDVMSHVYAYGVQCPDAKPIIHLGATSCYVGDNTDIIIMTEAMQLVKKRFEMLNSSHLQYVHMQISKSTSDIKNIKAYLIKALFNAPVTSNSFWQTKVNYDLANNAFTD